MEQLFEMWPNVSAWTPETRNVAKSGKRSDGIQIAHDDALAGNGQNGLQTAARRFGTTEENDNGRLPIMG